MSKKNAIQKAIEKADNETTSTRVEEVKKVPEPNDETKNKIPTNVDTSTSVENGLLSDLVESDVKANEGKHTARNVNSVHAEETRDSQQQNTSETQQSKESTQGEKVEKRGRHAKGCECEKCKNKAPKQPTQEKSARTMFDEDMKGYTSVTANTQQATTNSAQPTSNAPVTIDVSKYITGALFLIALDSIMPSLILKLIGTRAPKYKDVDVKKIKLTATEKKELEPLADEVVKLVFGQMHPALAFLTAYGMITVGKLLALDDDDFK